MSCKQSRREACHNLPVCSWCFFVFQRPSLKFNRIQCSHYSVVGRHVEVVIIKHLLLSTPLRTQGAFIVIPAHVYTQNGTKFSKIQLQKESDLKNLTAGIWSETIFLVASEIRELGQQEKSWRHPAHFNLLLQLKARAHRHQQLQKRIKLQVWFIC